jgi:hypothetical protein
LFGLQTLNSRGSQAALLISWFTGALVPLKGRCELLCLSHDQPRTQQPGACQSPFKLLHFSEVTNEITPFASASWRSENPGCQTQADKKSASREGGKTHTAHSTQQKVVFSNAASDFPVHGTGDPVELGGVP